MRRLVCSFSLCLVLCPLSVLLVPQAPAWAASADFIRFTGSGHTFYGDWNADVTASHAYWSPGDTVTLEVVLGFSDRHLEGLAAAGVKADKLCVLITAERTFDATGWMRLPSDERMSTLLTPAGLAIEGGVQGAVTNRYGYAFKSPLDQFVSIATGAVTDAGTAGTRRASFTATATLPADLPPGLYRLRFDFGVMVGTRAYNFNGYTFAARPFSSEAGTITYFYSPVIPASGTDVAGRPVNGMVLQPRFPWVLLSGYNSNGYRGVVADEDQARFALSDRSLINDTVILPMYDDNGNRLAYSLEPQFSTDTIDAYQNIGWDWGTGELSVRITAPDGTTTDLGAAKFVAKSGNGPSTKSSTFTSWRPAAYGRYTVVARGWIADAHGRRYEGGGTYRFWIAKRMTLATATFQGMPYPVGSSYGRDIQFNPAVPADVTVSAALYVNSDRANVRTLTYSGKATTAGLFGATQGMKSFPLDAPGEYHAQVLATYADPEGHLWVSTMRHAGVVYDESSPVIARGKKFSVGGKYVERGATNFEGYVEPNGTQHLAHITFPYQAGDVLLIAAEGQGANKIEPVLTYQMQGDTAAWDTTLNGVGTTNLRIKTSNGYSPHLYPEYITDLEYYYGAAPRPGFMGRFLVGESTVRAPYWSVSPNSFGGQIGASANGDAPGDIYRLLGGIVMRRQGQSPMYSGYIASAFLLPKGTNNNRVVSAGPEDLYGPLGTSARFFLVGLRPGTAYEVGATFRPALQIDPILPVSIRYAVTYPDGREVVAEGTGDRFGSFAGATAWPLDVPGVYKYRITARWNGFQSGMPGLPESGGEFYVYSKSRPSGAAGLKIDGATQRTFSAGGALTVTGSSGAPVVHYALITPGAVIEQGDVEVLGGRFQYVFDPARVHTLVPLYDVVSITTGKPQIGRVIHLTFFSEEKAAGGPFFDVARVILRGTTAISARGTIPASASAGATAAAGEAAASRSSTVQAGVADLDHLRRWDREIDRLVRDGSLRTTRREVDTLIPARLHERLQQYVQDVPVFGADLTRQIDGGVTVSAFGRLYPDLLIDTTPVIDVEQALDLTERRTGGRALSDVPPTLWVLPLSETTAALAWRTEVRTTTESIVTLVHASSGAVLQEWRSPLVEFAGAGLQSDIGTVAEVYRRRFVRDGVDGHGAPASAAAAGAPALDLAAHTFTHDVDAREARLIPRGEAGALREGFADILATAIEFDAQPSGIGPARAEYVIGEDAVRGGLRSLADPRASDHADHYDARDRGDADNGGVHANATIAGHAYYLAIEGGTHGTSGVSVNGVGREHRTTIDQAFYRTFVYLLPANATFTLARAATLQALRDLVGEGSRAEEALAQAWTAVGVR